MARSVGRFPTKFKPLKFTRADYLELPRKRHGPILHRGPSRPSIGPTEIEMRAIPIEEVYGSLPERILYKEFQRRRVTFSYQSSMLGGRLELGGMVADFILYDYGAVVRVQGTYWHTGAEPEARDAQQKAILENRGWDVWDIWDWEVLDEDIMTEWLDRHLEGVLI